jgi:hypothetical protein
VRIYIIALFVWLISHQPAVLFSQDKSAISNQPTILFSQNKPEPATSQPNRLIVSALTKTFFHELLVRKVGSNLEKTNWREVDSYVPGYLVIR